MNRIEKLKYAKEIMNWQADANGNVYNKKGRNLGYLHPRGYVYSKIVINEKTYSLPLHQFVYYYFNGEYDGEIDHINGNKSDNKISNLRAVSHILNSQNRRTAKGVYKRSNGKFQSYIQRNGKSFYLGCFDEESDAQKARMNFIKNY